MSGMHWWTEGKSKILYRSPSSDKSSGSKSTSHQQQSVQIFQKTLSSSTRESCFSPVGRKSPSLPDLRPGVSKSGATSQLLHKALSGKDSSPAPSRSPPSLQPELRPVKSSNSPSSLIQKHPLDLIVNSTGKFICFFDILGRRHLTTSEKSLLVKIELPDFMSIPLSHDELSRAASYMRGACSPQQIFQQTNGFSEILYLTDKYGYFFLLSP